MRYAKRCGVRASTQGLARNAGLMKHLLGAAAPDGIIRALIEANRDGELGEIAPHLFSFGGIGATATVGRQTPPRADRALDPRGVRACEAGSARNLSSRDYRTLASRGRTRNHSAPRRSPPECAARCWRGRPRRCSRGRRSPHCCSGSRSCSGPAVDLDAALVGRLGDRRDEVAGFLRLVRIADVDRAHAGIEERHEGELAVEHRRHALVRRMRAEAPAALAEILRRPACSSTRPSGISRSSHRRTTPSAASRRLPHSFTSDSSTIITMSRSAPDLSLANCGIAILPSGKTVCAPTSGDICNSPITGARRLSGVGSFGPLMQLLAVEDLQHAALVGAVAEIDAVALRPGRDAAMQFGRDGRAGRARLLPRQCRSRGCASGFAGSLRS